MEGVMAEPGQVRAAGSSPQLDTIPPVSPAALAKASGQRRLDVEGPYRGAGNQLDVIGHVKHALPRRRKIAKRC